ncbi:hypothetical protein SCHPADRAFT_896383 [Schizopora paradoxa]|uniref:Uncharacterized protein n=1 Tax=Schizopora paradoxa TaxID=27342 RepID=A0A0H2R1T5_9AGAM|nr:hypothetical protein SCHPADRAFT_896383 [Schizopora paradoxa]
MTAGQADTKHAAELAAAYQSLSQCAIIRLATFYNTADAGRAMPSEIPAGYLYSCHALNTGDDRVCLVVILVVVQQVCHDVFILNVLEVHPVCFEILDGLVDGLRDPTNTLRSVLNHPKEKAIPWTATSLTPGSEDLRVPSRSPLLIEAVVVLQIHEEVLPLVVVSSRDVDPKSFDPIVVNTPRESSHLQVFGPVVPPHSTGNTIDADGIQEEVKDTAGSIVVVDSNASDQP